MAATQQSKSKTGAKKSGAAKKISDGSKKKTRSTVTSGGAKKSTTKYGKAASKSVESAMHRKNEGTLRSGKNGKSGKVTSRKKAIAIGLSEAREKGANVPKKKTSGR